MAIDTVSSTSNALSRANSMGVEDFLKILSTQLAYQDPLKPIDNQQFLAQMAQFTSLEQTQRLNDKMELLVNNQASLQSIGLIGRNVRAQVNGTVLSGVVSALDFSSSTPMFTLTSNGASYQNIPLSQLLAVN